MVKTYVRNCDDLAEMSPTAYEEAIDRTTRELGGCSSASFASFASSASFTNSTNLKNLVDKHFQKKKRQDI